MFETMAVEIEQLLGKVTQVIEVFLRHLGGTAVLVSVMGGREHWCGCYRSVSEGMCLLLEPASTTSALQLLTRMSHFMGLSWLGFFSFSSLQE